jgi:hypothetical protein
MLFIAVKRKDGARDYKDEALGVIFFQYPLVSLLDKAYPASSINQYIKGGRGGTLHSIITYATQ